MNHQIHKHVLLCRKQENDSPYKLNTQRNTVELDSNISAMNSQPSAASKSIRNKLLSMFDNFTSDSDVLLAADITIKAASH